MIDDDFGDDDEFIIEDSVAFNSKLDGFYTYERKQFAPNLQDPLYLMNIDVSATVEKEYTKGKVQTENGQSFTEKEYVLKKPLIQIYCAT